ETLRVPTLMVTIHAVRGYRVDGKPQDRFQRSRGPRTRSEHAMESPASFSISESANRKYPTADPKNRLLNRGRRRWNASHRAADLPHLSPMRAVHRTARSANEPTQGDAAPPVCRMNPRRS